MDAALKHFNEVLGDPDTKSNVRTAIDNMRQVSPAVRIPMTIPYLSVPVGAVLILINTVCMMLLPEDTFAGEEDMVGAL